MAALGIILCVVGGNASLSAKFDEKPGVNSVPARRGSKLSAATGRLAMRTGIVLVLIGGGLFVLGIIISSVRVVLTMLFFVVIVVAVLSAWGCLRRPQSR